MVRMRVGFTIVTRSLMFSFSHVEESLSTSSEAPFLQNARRSILPWRTRKLSFQSPKTKGEPLLKKDNEEEGGDDIDYDCR